MTLKSAAIKTGIAAIALTSLGLAAAVPASAHTSNMYTFLWYDDDTEQAGFATYSKTDATTAYLPTTFVTTGPDVLGIEVANEKGTAVYSDGEDFFMRTWNHTTGERSDPTPMTIPAADSFDDFAGLDTLNDGTTITLVEFGVDFGEGTTDFQWIASLNDAGQLNPLVDLSSVLSVGGNRIFYFTSVATDPTSGITYVFLEDVNDGVFFLPVVVANNTVGTPTQFTGTGFDAGSVEGSDFDVDGTLYFNYFDELAETAPDTLSKLGSPSTWATAARIEIAPTPAEGSRFISIKALTIEHTALAATGSELPILAIVLVGSVAVLAGGVTVMVARRRSETGTV